MRFITVKKEQILHLPSFCSYFSLQTVVFVEKGRKNISCSRVLGTLATPLGLRPLPPPPATDVHAT